MYVVVIIGVDTVCMCGRRFNRSPIHIKGVGFAKVLGVFCEIDVREVQIDFAKVQGVSCENDIGIIPVDFTQIQEFFIKLPSIECISILSKFRGSFVKFTFTKVQGSFAKLPSMNCGLISPTFEYCFSKFTSSIVRGWIS